jgi:RNA polymerase sigma factor (sigma-70 family)
MQVVSQATRAVDVGGDAAEQDPKARFEELFRANSRPILAYALRRVAQPEDAADVLSEVMLIAWRRLDDVPPGREARLWLFGVAQRVLANQSRSDHRRSRLGERLRQTVSETFARDHAEAHESRDAVRAAVWRLPEADRELLLLVSWEGLEPSEAAQVLAITASTARTRLHRARARLRTELTEEES